MVRNFLEGKSQLQDSAHGGSGRVQLFEILGSDDFESNCEFLDRQVIPPGATVGYHQHGNDEELYIFLRGAGLMTIDGQEFAVKKGDVVKNRPYGAHGLANNSKEEIELLVIKIAIS